MKEIAIQDLKLNPLTVFGKDWMALTAGNEKHGCNAMTVAWGHFGSIWERNSHRNCLPTAVCYVRPSRYTKEFMDKEEYFTLSHFPEKYRSSLGYMGSHSGRDGDKFQAAGVTPVYADGTVYFAEADMVFICRKLYCSALTENGFVDEGLIGFNYPEKDFHTMYIGEIIKILTNEEN